MTIGYKGCDKDFEYRLAEINFDEENEKESELARRLTFFLERVRDIQLTIQLMGICHVK